MPGGSFLLLLYQNDALQMIACYLSTDYLFGSNIFVDSSHFTRLFCPQFVETGGITRVK